MTTTPAYIALLRGINVGGHARVPMAELRAMLTALGFTGVQSLLQSGNVVFRHARGRRGSPETIERRLEAALPAQIGVGADILVRTAAEWRAIVERNPFPAEAAQDPGHVLVMCLRTAPLPAAVRAFDAVLATWGGPERVRADGRQLYLVYPAGIGRSRVTGALIEKALGTRGTARNWNTVLKLDALVRV